MRSTATVLTLAFLLAGCSRPTTAATTGDDDNISNGDTDTTSGGSLTARIVRPNGDLAVLSGTAVTLEAEFFDGGAAVFPADVNWDTHVFLGRGNPLPDVLLADGVHTVTVSATVGGQTATDSVTVSVGSFAVRILDPADGSAETVGGNVRFRGEANTVDPGGPVELVSGPAGAGQRVATYAWSSDLDGQLSVGQNDFGLDSLTEGTHMITLTVTDDDPTSGTGRSGSASVTLVIRPPNQAPVVTITDPAACPVEVDENGTLSFAAAVDDPDEPDLQGTWLDTVTGDTAAGGTFATTGGALGMREVVFSAIDAQGAADSASCEVWVVAASSTQADFFPDTSGVNAGLVGGNDNVNWIGVDPDGNTWAGNDLGIAIYDGAGTSTAAYDGTDLGVGTGPDVRDADVAGGTAFIATDLGLAQCDYAAGALSNCTSIQGGEFGGVDVSADPAASAFLAAAADGGLYLAAYSGGAITDDQVFDPSNSNLPSGAVRDVEWVAGTLHAATDAGVCVVEHPAGALAGIEDLCTELLTEATTLLPSNDVKALAVDGETLWIGTENGLVRYDTIGGSMAVWDQDRGLAGDARSVNDVAIDSAGILWLGTDNGLVRLDPATGNVTRIDGSHWVPPAPGRNVNAVSIDVAGVKWLATNDGVVQYSGS